MTSPVKHSPHTATRRRNGLTDQARRDAAARLRSQEIRALVEAELAPIVDAITAKVAGDEPQAPGARPVETPNRIAAATPSRARSRSSGCSPVSSICRG